MDEQRFISTRRSKDSCYLYSDVYITDTGPAFKCGFDEFLSDR